MKPFSTYKDSGMEWIGDIPSHWGTLKLKFIGQVIIGLSYNPEDIDDEGNGTLVMRSSNIQNGKPTFLDNVFVNTEIPEDLRTREGDILICSRNGSRNLIGKNCVITKDIEGMTFGVFMSVFRSHHWRFVYWVLNSPVFESQSGLYLTSTINQLTVSTLQNMIIPFTSNENEQQKIVRYLNEQARKIDDLVKKTEKKIKLLNEKRTSLINHCVTKGLNPNVEKKDSGVEWIGEIPSHWKCGKLNYLSTRIGDGLHSTPSYVDESGYYFVNGNNLKDGKVVIFGNTKCVDESEYKKYFIELNVQTLLLSINGTIGNVAFYNNENIILGKSVCYINCSDDVDNKFVFYLIQSDSIQRYFTFELTGTTILNLSLYSIRKTPIPYPELHEQRQIIDYLDEQTEKIDSTIKKETQRIELLKEYRQSLISEVVTGKIDVRDLENGKELS